MSDARANGWRGAAFALLRSYVADLRRWAGELASGYAVAAALLVGSVLALFAAVAVGITALFHLVERHYGTDAAYGGIGSGLLVLAIVLFVSAWALLRRQMPPFPREERRGTLMRSASVGSLEPTLLSRDRLGNWFMTINGWKGPGFLNNIEKVAGPFSTSW
jgi:hypothetical protein